MVNKLGSEVRSFKIFLQLPGVDERRARAIYDAGYHTLAQLRSVELAELVKVPSINPTLARRILYALQSSVGEDLGADQDGEMSESDDDARFRSKFKFQENPGKLLYVIKKPLALLPEKSHLKSVEI